jgi:hypothetical protein
MQPLQHTILPPHHNSFHLVRNVYFPHQKKCQLVLIHIT